MIFICCSELSDISLLASYVHLRYVDLSGNNLRDVSALNSLQHLLAVQLRGNKLTSADIPTELPYLQTISFANNRIQSLAGISHPVLESLNLNCKTLLHAPYLYCHIATLTRNKSIVPCWTMHTGRMSCHSTKKGVNYYICQYNNHA